MYHVTRSVPIPSANSIYFGFRFLFGFASSYPLRAHTLPPPPTPDRHRTTRLKLTKVFITAPTRHAKRYRDLDGPLPRDLILHAICHLLLMV
eukprot:scaffold41846_cov57-Phaeocystis_antarctica.AAC.3